MVEGERKGARALDAWSLVHLVSGVALGVVGLRPVLAVVLVVGFEGFEAWLRRVRVKGGRGLFEYESWPNIVADIIIGLAGYFAVHLFWPGLWPIGF